MFESTKGGPLGSGQAGRYWQSMMTEHIARHIASSGRLRLLTQLPRTPRSLMRAHGNQTIPRGNEQRKLDRSSSWQTIVVRDARRNLAPADIPR
ncbi:MAG: rod-binding protein [Hyphomicrobiaceae bacterium]